MTYYSRNPLLIMLRALSEIDIIDLNYSNSYYSGISKSKISIIKIFIKILKIFYFFVLALCEDIKYLFLFKNIKNKHVLFCVTTNQYNALYPLKSAFNDSIILGTNKLIKDRLFMSIGCFLSLLLTPYFIYSFATKNKQQKLLICEFLPNYFYIYGIFYWWYFYLRLFKPKTIIFSNDHILWTRILRLAAKDAGIPTIYIQHASVTDLFPKLEFDLSLLDGQDALQKYLKKGIEGKYELVGMPKFDKYFNNINRKKYVETVGICTNILDDEIQIEQLCICLRNSFRKLKIYLRPHPRDNRSSFYNELIKNYQCIISNSNEENSFEFLKNVDAIIANESSIHLEAVLMNVYPVYVLMNDSKKDHYGYIRNGLVTDVFEDVKDVVIKIQELTFNKSDIRERAKFYVDTINTENDGNSVVLCKKHIDNLFVQF